VIVLEETYTGVVADHWCLAQVVRSTDSGMKRRRLDHHSLRITSVSIAIWPNEDYVTPMSELGEFSDALN
jgi:hypothetical protein